MDSSTRALVLTVTQYWKGFDLDSKRVMLDAQGVSMQEQKEHSLKSRKALAEHTKKFRKLVDTDKVAAMPSLLKAYQEEIDTLTKRAKYSDNSFFALYKALYEAPDPVPALDAALLLESTPPAPSSTDKTQSIDLVAKLRRELASYESEFASLKNQDITIRNLEAKLAAMEDNMERHVEDKVHAQCSDLENTLRLREADMALHAAQADKCLHQAREARDDALAQLDLMRSELFRAKQHADHVHAVHASETQSLLTDLSRFHGAVSTMQWELEIAQKDAVIAQHEREILRLQDTMAGQTSHWTAQVTALQCQVTELSDRPTVAAYEQALQAHQQVAGLTSVEASYSTDKGLNAMISDLQAQLVAQKHVHESTVKQLELANAATVSRHVSVIAQLESALDEALDTTTRKDMPSSILGDVLGSSNRDKDAKLVAIVRQQRDRAKDKLKHVEAEWHRAVAAAQAASTRLRQLEVENVDLVQKMRYVSSSSNQRGDLETGKHSSSLYEARMNPFDQFKQMESAARVAQLNPLDKIMLVSARLILSHPFTRMGLLVYLVVLHSLVMGTLYLSMHLCNISNHT
ncbi:hypothetical protein B5M09_008425 [Aphanomyces astaci]|uniref:Protein CASP n=1 Tax=Aphanomyces astaci TaxID=112090 RepID=A0A3R7YB05_APHAT|nr:hypothetical protein B5M09_008425 [Aphanomyces astaci]